METTTATFGGVELSACAARIADDLCGPEAAIEAACLIHGDIERALGGIRSIVDSVECSESVKCAVKQCVHEVDTYAYVLGVMVNDARDGVSCLRAVAASATS